MVEEETKRQAEETTASGTEQGAAGDTGEGNQPEESKAVARLRKENERMAKVIARKKELIKEQQDLEARETLGGESLGPAREEQKFLTPKEYKDSIMRGVIPTLPVKKD